MLRKSSSISEIGNQNTARSSRAKRLCALLALSTAVAGLSARAGSDTWDGSSSATWGDTTNWLTDSTIPGAGDTATFNGGGNGNVVIDLGGGVTIGNIVFDGPGAAAYTIGAGAVGSQLLTLNAGGAISVGPTVVTNQLFNAALTLEPSSASYSIINNSTTGSLTFGSTITGGGGATQTLTFGGAGNVTINGLLNDGSGGVLNITKTGSGYLRLGGPTTNIEGILDVQGGTVGTTNDLVVKGLTGTGGAIENGTNADKWFFINQASDTTYGGILRNGGGTGLLGFVKQGTGSITLTNSANNLNSNFAIENGRVILNNTGTYGSSGQGGAVRVNHTASVGSIAGANAVLVVNGATINYNNRSGNANQNEVFRGSLAIASNATASGSVTLNSGSITTFRQLGVATTGTAYGAYTQNGGTTTVGGFFAVGLGSATGMVNQTAGVFNANGPITIGGGGASFGTLSLSGSAVFNQNTTAADNGMWIAESGTAVVNVSDSASLTVNPAQVIQLGRNNVATSNGTLNLLGGTVTARAITKPGAAATGTLNFNGGTLRANADNASFLTGLTNAYVHAGGAKIDDNGFNITVGQALLDPSAGGTAQGVSTTGLTVSGSGFINTPRVVISGGGGTGATAVATVDSAGNLTGIVMTNPGTGYTEAPTFSLVGGGASATSSIEGTASLTPLSSGGLTKSGSGRTTLSGVSTYTGATTVSGGRLIVSSTGSISGTSGVTINGSGSRLVYNSSSPLTSAVSLVNGSLDGTGSLDIVNVADSATNTILNGDGTTAPLTIGSLSFAGAGEFSLNVASTSPVVNLGSLALSSSSVKVNASNALWTEGTYNLISYGLVSGSTSVIEKGVISGLSNRQSATLSTAGGFVSLSIEGDNPRWSGAVSNAWTTATVNNWSLITSGNPTFYIEGDLVLFDDTATTTTPSISSANVAPSAVVFDNSSKNYTLGGAFGITGGANVTKQGSGSLTITNANSHTGGTTVSAGQLNIDNAGALGNGPLVLASGVTVDNTSGSAVTVAGANAQTWNGAVIFGGSNALNMGTGAVTRTAATTVTVNGTAPVTIGGAITGSDTFTKDGPGTLVLAGASTYTTATNVAGGTLTVSGSVTNTSPVNVSGGGQLNVTGTMAHNGASITNGSVAIAGTVNATGDYWVGHLNGGTGSLTVQSGGTLNGDVVLAGGGLSPTAVASGNIVIEAGGTISTNRWFVVGQSGAAPSASTATINGTLNVRTVGTQGTLELGTFDGLSSTLNINPGATVRIQNNSIIALGAAGHSGTATVNQEGGDVTFYSDGGITPGGTGGLVIGADPGYGAASGVYNYNLNGGTLTTPRIFRQSNNNPTSNFNFNGGTLRATESNATFLAGISRANVRNGGAVIDTNGFDVTVSQPLVHSNIDGDNAIDGGLTKNGAGTLVLRGVSTYTGPTVVNSGTIQLPLAVTPAAIGHYSFDELPDGGLAQGAVVANTGTGGAAMDGSVNHADNFFDPFNGDTSVVTGQFGKAVSFGGFGSSIDIASRVADQAGGGSWTFSAWVKTTTPGSSIMSKNSANLAWDTGDSVFYLGSNPISGTGGNLPTAVRFAGGFMQGDPAPTNVTDDAWHMVTYVSDGGTKAVYVDGVLATLTQGAFNNADTATSIRLGYNINTFSSSDGTFNFTGAMDELKFFEAALTASQIQSLFASNSVSGGGQQYLPAATPVTLAGPTSKLDLNGNNQTIGSLAGVAGSEVLLGEGTLTVGDAANTSFAGGISGTGGLTKVGAGTLSLGGANSFSGATTVSEGTLEIAADFTSSGSIAVAAGATLDVAPSGDTVIKTGTLAIDAAGVVNLRNNDLAIDYTDASPIADLIAALSDGRLVVDGDVLGLPTFIAISEAADLGLTEFGGVAIDETTVVAKFTYVGDANLDGQVDALDYERVDLAIGNAGVFGTAQGDLNYDGNVDALDYEQIDLNIGNGVGSPLAGVFIPEPASLSLLAVGAGMMARRRRA